MDNALAVALSAQEAAKLLERAACSIAVVALACALFAEAAERVADSAAESAAASACEADREAALALIWLSETAPKMLGRLSATSCI